MIGADGDTHDRRLYYRLSRHDPHRRHLGARRAAAAKRPPVDLPRRRGRREGGGRRPRAGARAARPGARPGALQRPIADRDPHADLRRPAGRRRADPPADRSAIAFRGSLAIDATAYRLVHGEADLLPSLVVDRYGDYLVVQALSQGMDRLLPLVVATLGDLLPPRGILARNDPRARLLEGLEQRVDVLAGDVPESVGVIESGIEYDVDLRRGQKTGLFLDQRENREAAARVRARTAARLLQLQRRLRAEAGRPLPGNDRDRHLRGRRRPREGERRAQRRSRSTRASATCSTSCAGSSGWASGSTRSCSIRPRSRRARRRSPKATSGYKEINLRALKLLNPGGTLVTCSCSYNVDEAAFAEIVYDASVDAQAHVTVVEKRMQGRDHPVLLGVPETYYLKCFILRKTRVTASVGEAVRRVHRELAALARTAGDFDASRYFRGGGRPPLLQRRAPPRCARWRGRSRASIAKRLDDRRRARVRRSADRRSVSRDQVGRDRSRRAVPAAFTPRLLEHWKRWLARGHSANWATTDAICGLLIGPLVVAHPSLARRMRAWARHRSLWVRRAAAVGLIASVRAGAALDVGYAVARTLSRDDEDLIQKAVGWMLREAGKADATRLERYLREHGRTTPRTTVRYAIERFPPTKRKALLAATRPRS